VLRVEELVLPIVLSVQSPIERDHFIRKIADATGLGEQAIRESLKKVTAIPALHNDALPDTFSGTAPDKEVLVGSDARRAPLEALLALYPDESSSVFIREALERIIPDAPALHIPERTLFEIGMTYETPPSREMAQELVNDFERVFVREAIDEASRLLRQADARNDNTLAATLTETIAKYTRRLRELSAHT